MKYLTEFSALALRKSKRSASVVYAEKANDPIDLRLGRPDRRCRLSNSGRCSPRCRREARRAPTARDCGLREGSSRGRVCHCTLQGAALHAEDDELTIDAGEVGLASSASPTSRSAAAGSSICGGAATGRTRNSRRPKATRRSAAFSTSSSRARTSARKCWPRHISSSASELSRDCTECSEFWGMTADIVGL
jgi:hypothetical protein